MIATHVAKFVLAHSHHISFIGYTVFLEFLETKLMRNWWRKGK